jgi:hypothetical protein
MLMKLTPGDDIPLRLGARLPRPEEKARNIAEMERIAKVLDDLDGEVRWVVNAEAAGGEGRIDPTIQTSDYEGAIEAGVIENYRENPRQVIDSVGLLPAVAEAAPPWRLTASPDDEYASWVRKFRERFMPGGEVVGPYTKQGDSYLLVDPPAIPGENLTAWMLIEPTGAEVREYFKASATRPQSPHDHDHALMDRRLALRAFLREQRAGVSAKTALEMMRGQQTPHALRDALDAVNEQQRLDAIAMREHEERWAATERSRQQKRLEREAIAQWTPPPTTPTWVGIDREVPPADFTAFCRKP